MIQTPEQFAAARHRLDLSVSQCAVLVNVEIRTIRRWESGERDPHPSACRILEIGLHCQDYIRVDEILRIAAEGGFE